jgi:hypothetical protein
MGFRETVADVLSRWDAPFEQLDERGLVVVVDPDALGIPAAYAIGTETVREETFPWPETDGVGVIDFHLPQGCPGPHGVAGTGWPTGEVSG